MLKCTSSKKAALMAFLVALSILFRQDYLFDTDPYLHLATAKHVSKFGFPEIYPFVKIMGGEGFNFVSEKWLFIYILSSFYKIPINDILAAKIFISLVFSSTVFVLAKTLEEMKVNPLYSLFLLALPFQVLLKLRPEPLGILLSLVLVLILLKEFSLSLKIAMASVILILHSQIHAFFFADVAILLVYAYIYKAPKALLSIISLIGAVLLNPYKGVWLSTLYFDTVPRLSFPSSALMPSELLSPNLWEMAIFFAFYVLALKISLPFNAVKKKFVFILSFLTLVSAAVVLRMISYATCYLTITIGIFFSRHRNIFFRSFLLSLLTINVMATLLAPGFMMSGYDEDLQKEILTEIRSDDVVLTQWDLSPYVIYYANATTVNAGDIYYIWLFSKQTHRDYEDFFSGKNKSLADFNATVLYFDKIRFADLYNNEIIKGNLRLVSENKRFVAFRI